MLARYPVLPQARNTASSSLRLLKWALGPNHKSAASAPTGSGGSGGCGGGQWKDDSGAI